MKLDRDHWLHLGACAFITLVGFYVFGLFLSWPWDLVLAGILALGIGIGKEVGDAMSSGNKFDITDIVADLIGIAGSVVIVFVIRFISNLFTR